MSPGGVEQLKDEGTRTQVIVAGSAAGLVSRFCIAPLDVIKIRLQLQVHSLADPLDLVRAKPAAIGALDTFKSILKEEGLTALWKGNVPAEILYLTYGAVQFSVYRSTTAFLRSSSWLFPKPLPSTAESFIAGAAAGTVATTVTYPLDLLRTRFAAQGSDRVYSNLVGSIRDIAKNEGMPGFFRGVGAGVVGIVPYMGLFFACYETFKVPLADQHLPWGSGDATAGVLSSIISKTAVFPLDTVRKRLQVQGPSRMRYGKGKIPVYRGVAGTVKAILKREGTVGLYRGLGVSLLKAAPASAVTMWTYERIMHLLVQWDQGAEG